MTLLLVVLILTSILFLMRHRLGNVRIDWRTWIGFALGAAITLGVMRMAEPLGLFEHVHILPAPLFKVAMIIIGGLLMAAELRAPLDKAIPPRREDGCDDASRRR